MPSAPGPRAMPTSRNTATSGTRVLRATRLEAMPNSRMAPMVNSRCLASSMDVGCKTPPQSFVVRPILLVRPPAPGRRFLVVDQVQAPSRISGRLGLAFTGTWRYDSRALASCLWRVTPEQNNPSSRLPERLPGPKTRTTETAAQTDSNGGFNEQGATQESRNRLASQVPDGRSSGHRGRRHAGL